MKTKKEFDAVKMMREIRDKFSAEMQNMSTEQILEYIKKGSAEFQKSIAKSSH